MKIKQILNKKFLAGAILAIPLFFSLSNISEAYTQINNQLDPGAKGVNVTNLQTFFADNSSIYPEGLITGYYGPLTTKAVIRFQAENGLSQVGRVGPLTMAKINSLIANGGWGDHYAPIMYPSTVNVGRDTASFAWTTNENATARVFYSTTPVTINEGDINSNGFGVINGNTAYGSSLALTSQQVTISGLSPNTTYYYILVSRDANGNISVSDVNKTFKTTN